VSVSLCVLQGVLVIVAVEGWGISVGAARDSVPAIAVC
jgi:hypothetical protein